MFPVPPQGPEQRILNWWHSLVRLVQIRFPQHQRSVSRVIPSLSLADIPVAQSLPIRLSDSANEAFGGAVLGELGKEPNFQDDIRLKNVGLGMEVVAGATGMRERD